MQRTRREQVSHARCLCAPLMPGVRPRPIFAPAPYPGCQSFEGAISMKKLIVTSLLILFAGLNCFAQKEKTEKVCITDQEYEIYNVVGVGNYQNETFTQRLSEYAVTELQNISPEIIADFNTKNSRKYLLRCLNKTDGKTAKLRKSKGGNASTSFSRIGLSRDGTEALVYHYWEAVGNYCGGEFVLLRKSANKWEVVKKVTTVIC
jgi:hypothetical protein